MAKLPGNEPLYDSRGRPLGCLTDINRLEAGEKERIYGRLLMLQINEGFRPGGVLCRRLDGSTPFRMPGMEKTDHGRSWAIHDGIMDEKWDGVRIYKMVGESAGVNTFPGLEPDREI